LRIRFRPLVFSSLQCLPPPHSKPLPVGALHGDSSLTTGFSVFSSVPWDGISNLAFPSISFWPPLPVPVTVTKAESSFRNLNLKTSVRAFTPLLQREHLGRSLDPVGALL